MAQWLPEARVRRALALGLLLGGEEFIEPGDGLFRDGCHGA
ncbi:MAG: hypothetical protein WEB60_11780 [Terrimicrobiaceae bacterium]